MEKPEQRHLLVEVQEVEPRQEGAVGQREVEWLNLIFQLAILEEIKEEEEVGEDDLTVNI